MKKIDIWRKELMDKNFSEGFMHDIAVLFDGCVKNNTDNVDVTLICGDKKLTMNITFSVKKN